MGGKLKKRHGSGRTQGNLPSHIRLMHWNIEGVISEVYGNKLEDEEVLAVINKHDLIAITETHASERTKLDIPGFRVKSIVRKKSQRAKRYSGGIAFAVREELEENIEVINSDSENIMWVKIKRFGSPKHLMLGIVYISPITSTYTQNVLGNPYRTWEILGEEIAQYKTQFDICLVGDFNARTSSLDDYIMNDDDKYVSLPVNYACDSQLGKRTNIDVYESCAFGSQLLDLCKMSEMRIINGRKLGDSAGKMTCHRWNGSSVVDYIVADKTIYPLIQTFQVLDLLEQISDHCPISAVINLSLIKRWSNANNTYSISVPKKVKWNAQSEGIFKLRLTDQNVQTKLLDISNNRFQDGEGIDRAVQELSQIFTHAADIPGMKKKNISRYKQKKAKRTKKPWFGDELTKLRRNLKTAGQALAKNFSNNIMRQSFFKLKKQYKSAVASKKKQYKQILYRRIEELHNENPKEYWELFDQLKDCDDNTNTSSNCPIDENEWINHYTKLLGPKRHDADKAKEIEKEVNAMKNEPYFSELDYQISQNEIFKAVKSLKNNKAVGIDQISNEMIKAAMPLMINPLKNIFNAILCNKHYPEAWKLGIIVNLFKSGDIYDTDNYRGLTINSCLAKVFNTIMNNRLISYLDKNRVISDKQIGFKKKARTSDHIFVINTLFRKFMKGNKKLYMCFVDFRKAYDSVWRDALMMKLMRSGIKGNFFGVIENMYQGCKSCIKGNGVLSDVFPCDTGVRQGDVMSPNLFNLYINDLPDLFENDTDSPMLVDQFIHCLLYADDLVLLSLSVDGLQNKLNRLHEYCEKWALTINTKKTQVMCMTNDSISDTERVIYLGEVGLKWVSSYKYLGIEIHCDGKMQATMENLCVRGWKATFKIRSAFKGLDVCPATRLKFFDALVRPIICYGSEVWGVLNNLHGSKSFDQFLNRLEKLPVENFQKRFCKGTLGVHRKASNAAVMGEVGRFPMFIFIIKSIIKFYQHIEDVKKCRPILGAAAEEDRQLPVRYSWYGSLQKILKIFNGQINPTTNYEKLITTVTSSFKRKYVESWQMSLKCKKNDDPDGGKLYLYRRIKTNFQMEPYLSHCKKRKYRQALSAIRFSAHRLEIETGRYVQKGNHICREERFCRLCEKDGIKAIGDEEHAMLVCPTFDKPRQKTLSILNSIYPNFCTLNNRNKLFFMLTCEGVGATQVGKLAHTVLMAPRYAKMKNKVKNKNRKKQV